MFQCTKVTACKNRRSFFASLIARSWIFFATTDGSILNIQPVSSETEGCLCDTLHSLWEFSFFDSSKMIPNLPMFLYRCWAHTMPPPPPPTYPVYISSAVGFSFIKPPWKIRDFSCKRGTVIYAPSFLCCTNHKNKHSLTFSYSHSFCRPLYLATFQFRPFPLSITNTARLQPHYSATFCIDSPLYSARKASSFCSNIFPRFSSFHPTTM